MKLIDFAILALATWRITMMLSDVTEAGPANLLHKIRELVGVKFDDRYEPYGRNWVATGMLCHKCLSVWVGLACFVGYLIAPALTLHVAFVFALSGITVLLERCNGN